MVLLYGVHGCGPCEVARLYLTQKGVPFEFIDLASDEAARRDVQGRLESPTSGVILEDGQDLEVMQRISVTSLDRWLQAYRERHQDEADPFS